jgi:hypothetical protein
MDKKNFPEEFKKEPTKETAKAADDPEATEELKPSPSVAKAIRIINYFFVLVEGLIVIRILLKALGGNPFNSFVNFIYSLTYPFVFPFLSAFNWQTANTGLGVFEFGSLLAIVFYILLNYAIVRLLIILTSREQ